MKNFENHYSKIVAAFMAWLKKSSPIKESVHRVSKFVSGLVASREKSMYVDVNDDSSLSIPSKIADYEVANNCIVLAEKLHLSHRSIC